MKEEVKLFLAIICFILNVVFVFCNDSEFQNGENPLDCIFEPKISPNCCWQTPNQSLATAKIHDQANHRWYAKRFRAVGLLPPESAFVAITANGASEGASIWESCTFCTSSGEFELTIRHWQSATAELEICWRPEEEENWQELESACMLMDPRTQFSIDPLAIRVPANLDIRLYFQLKNRSQMGTAIATVLVDYIHVQTEYCTNGEEQWEEESISAKKMEQTEFELADQKNGHQKDLITYEVAKPNLRAAPTKEMTDRENDTMNAIFGDKFANFLLDPKEEEEQGESDLMVKKNIKKINGQNSLIKVHKNIRPCFTFGGCRFEHSSCGFTNSQLFSSNSARFMRKKIGDSFIVEAKISPGEVAVFESATNMTDGPYFVQFNHFQSATSNSMQKPKFSACCFVNGRTPTEMECPFESEIFFPSIPIENKVNGAQTNGWKSGIIECPNGTTKLMFICEFYGTGSGICAIDGVRLHRADDKELKQICKSNEEELIIL